MRVLIIVALALLTVALPAPTRSQTPASGITRTGNFPASDASVRAAVCPHGSRCAIDFVVGGGTALQGQSFAIARARTAPTPCPGELGYRDFLISTNGRTVRRIRELVRGDAPCIEWELSSWTFADGEFVFTHSLMGAPTAPGTDNRPTHIHIRPSPLTITRAFRDDESVAVPSLPPRGPIVRLTEEQEEPGT